MEYSRRRYGGGAPAELLSSRASASEEHSRNLAVTRRVETILGHFAPLRVRVELAVVRIRQGGKECAAALPVSRDEKPSPAVGAHVGVSRNHLTKAWADEASGQMGFVEEVWTNR